MNTQTVFAVALCALLLVSAFECKKPKDAKNKNSKEVGKQQKEKQVDAKQHKEKSPKAEKAKTEKAVKAEKQEKPAEIKVKEVIIEAPEVIEVQKTEKQEHTHAAESVVDTINHHQQKPVIKPKSLKRNIRNKESETFTTTDHLKINGQPRLLSTTQVLNAYEQCKLECKKQRDNVQAQDYVEQLRTELAAAEATLAAEAAAVAASSSEAAVSQDNFN
ncbi:hypothetical protein ANCDUO_15266 [Ancylostoma duodenale]|uniref:Uncharacterized protein n=1 Tax=Ancylostoma duodenale TaxID=51022 RepID=A0A0C2CXL1_9BILA|nr:hypothetical protein ANCDUO_15266 [Ancylostoma duodenale]